MKRLALFLLLTLFAAAASAQLKLGASADNLLEPEKAFRFSARCMTMWRRDGGECAAAGGGCALLQSCFDFPGGKSLAKVATQ